jgi:hypothetical protein
LPKEIADKVTKKASETYALAAFDTAYALLLKRDFSAVSAQIREALRLSPSPKVIRRTGGFFLRAGSFEIQRMIKREGSA